MKDLKDRIYIASFSEGSIETAKKYGFGIEINHTCVSDNMNPENLDSTLDWIRKDLKEAGAENGKFLVHGPFTELSPSSIDSRAVALTWDRFMDALNINNILGSEKMVLHTGYFPFLYYPVWHKEKSVEFWTKFAKELPENVTLCIENVFEKDPLLFKEIIEEIDQPNVKICLDVGHVNALADKDWMALRWIDELAPLIRHFHLHNNVGGEKDLHDTMYKGTMDMEKVLDAALSKCTEDTTFTIESRTAEDSARWLTDLWKL